jgi:GT2 family glycosyltransferase
MRIAVVIASLGRPEEVGQLLRSLQNQTRRADQIVLSVTSQSDAPADLPADVLVLKGQKGLPVQRNLGMEAILSSSDLVAFFDDDYLPSRYALEGIAAFFSAHPDVVGINGRLLADGINSAGISFADACQLIDAHDAHHREDIAIKALLPDGLYGCNMVYRISAIGAARFDPQLPLYAWQEDLDFGVQVRARGLLAKTEAFVGVHRGVKGGRTSGVRLGYSQIANPYYLCRKGTMRWGFALRLMLRNFAANHAKAFRAEPWVDRLGRVKGNWLALGHLLTGKIAPGVILTL